MLSFDPALRDIAEAGTAVGVLLAVFQLRRQGQLAQPRFEDDLAREYRELTRLPPAALLGLEPDPDPRVWPADELAAIVQYIDLCNEQICLRAVGRISKSTWKDWEERIRHNFRLPYFRVAFAWVYQRTNALEPEKSHDKSYLRLHNMLGEE